MPTGRNASSVTTESGRSQRGLGGDDRRARHVGDAEFLARQVGGGLHRAVGGHCNEEWQPRVVAVECFAAYAFLVALNGGFDGDEREIRAAAGRDLRRLRPAAAEADLDVQPLFLEETGLIGNVDGSERDAGNGECGLQHELCFWRRAGRRREERYRGKNKCPTPRYHQLDHGLSPFNGSPVQIPGHGHALCSPTSPRCDQKAYRLAMLRRIRFSTIPMTER